jgi:cytochrome oxidase Cu insertion factor (SCO1/SenC/PrrC family)
MTDSDIMEDPVATSAVDRAAALAEGAPKVPRRVVVIAVIVAAVLALGGTALERLFSSVGLNPTPSAATPATTSSPTTLPELRASMAAFLGLVSLTPRPAPAIALTDQNGLPVALDQLGGKVVVLTFFDADCDDACPVLAADITRADADLGANRSRVVFLTVNTDPLETATDLPPAAATETGLSALGNWHFLTGSLTALDAVWRSYGVTINVSTASGVVAHNNVMYFVDPKGKLRTRATPVADESTTGAFSLPPASVIRSADGIAAYAAGLLPRSS